MLSSTNTQLWLRSGIKTYSKKNELLVFNVRGGYYETQISPLFNLNYIYFSILRLVTYDTKSKIYK